MSWRAWFTRLTWHTGLTIVTCRAPQSLRVKQMEDMEGHVESCILEVVFGAYIFTLHYRLTPNIKILKRCLHATYRPSFVSTGSSVSSRPRGSLSRQRIQSESSEDHVPSVIQVYEGTEKYTHNIQYTNIHARTHTHTELSGRGLMLTIGPGRPLIPGTCRKTITALTALEEAHCYQLDSRVLLTMGTSPGSPF